MRSSQSDWPAAAYRRRRPDGWILPDGRPLPAELVAFLDAGAPPVYAGFVSMPRRARNDIARVAIEAIHARGRRTLVSRSWTDLALIDDRDDCFGAGEVNQRAPFGRVGAVMRCGGAARNGCNRPQTELMT